MIWCRFELEGETNYGIVEEEGVIQVSGNPLDEYVITDKIHPLDSVKLLAPIKPAMLYAAGPNYRGHVDGMAARRGSDPIYPDRPSPNYRSVHAVIGTGENIVIPKGSSGAVQPEGQLAVVIGKKAKNVSVDELWTACLDIQSGTTSVNALGSNQIALCFEVKIAIHGSRWDLGSLPACPPKNFRSLCVTMASFGKIFRPLTRYGIPLLGFMNLANMPLCIPVTFCGWGRKELTVTWFPGTS